MDKNEILQEVTEGINDGYDMNASVAAWIEEVIFKLFDELLSKGIKLDENEKKELLDKLIKLNSAFFNDKLNVIYLKLINLYNKTRQTSGENQELYYVVDRFSPAAKEIETIIKQMQEIIKTKDFRDFIEKHFNYDSVLLPYKEARDSAESALDTSKDPDVLTEAIEVLDGSLSTYGNKEYVTDIIEGNRKDYYYEVIERMGIDLLATIYCKINGNAFTDAEKSLLASELSQVQQNTLFDAVNGKKR